MSYELYKYNSIDPTAYQIARSWNSQRLADQIISAWLHKSKILLINPSLSKCPDFKNQLVELGVDPEKDFVSNDSFLSELPAGFHAVLLTSGTTGRPRFVALDAASVLWNCKLITEQIKLSSEHHFLGHLPFFHAFGLVLSLINSFELRAPFWLAKRFHAEDCISFLQNLDLQRAKVFLPLVPRQIELLAETGRSSNVNGVCVIGGDCIEEQHLSDLSHITPSIKQTIGYGCTEAGPALCHSDLNQRLYSRFLGKELKGVKIKLNPQGVASFLSPGQAAWIYNEGQKSWEWSKEKWLSVGDILCQTEDGWSFVSRSSQSIKKNGEWLPIRFIEEQLFSFSGKQARFYCYVSKGRSKTTELKVKVFPLRQEITERTVKQCIAKLPSLYQPKFGGFIWEVERNALGKAEIFEY